MIKEYESKLYCVICSQYRKFEKPEISFILEKVKMCDVIKCK